MKKRILSCLTMFVLFVLFGAIAFPVNAAYYHTLPETPESYFGSYAGGGIIDIWDRDGYGGTWSNKRSFVVDDITAVISQDIATINFTADIAYELQFCTVIGDGTLRFEEAVINGLPVLYKTQKTYLLNTSITDSFQHVNIISDNLDMMNTRYAFSFFIDKNERQEPSISSQLPGDGIYEGKIRSYTTSNGYWLLSQDNVAVRYEKRGLDSILTIGDKVIELSDGIPVPGHRLQYPCLPQDLDMVINGQPKKGAYAGITFYDDNSCFIYYQEIRTGEDGVYSNQFCYTGTLFLNEREIVEVNETVDDIFDPARGYKREHRVIIPGDGYITVDIFADLDEVTWEYSNQMHHKLFYNLIRNQPDEYQILYKSYSETYDNKQWKDSVRFGVAAGDEISFIVGNDYRDFVLSPISYSFRVNFTPHNSWKRDPITEYTQAQPIALNKSIYGMIDHGPHADSPNWFILDVPANGVTVTAALNWPDRPELGIDIDYDKEGMKLFTVFRDLGTAEAYEYSSVQFMQGETLTLSKGRHYFYVNLMENMIDDKGNMYFNDIFCFTVFEANPDVSFTAQGYSNELVYDVIVEGSIPNQYPEGVTNLTYDEILALPVTIYIRNLLNGAVRDMGPSTIEVLKVTTVNGKIQTIEIRGRAQTNPGTLDRYTVVYSVP